MEFFAGKKKGKSRRARSGRQTDFTLGDLTKKIPKQGLLDPKLRRGVGRLPTTKQVLG